MMRDPRTCPHTDTEPVDVRDPSTGVVGTVARICIGCLDRLPAAWGCGDCSWIEERSYADIRPTLSLGSPCPRHMEHA